jgi:hypothetical protein
MTARNLSKTSGNSNDNNKFLLAVGIHSSRPVPPQVPLTRLGLGLVHLHLNNLHTCLPANQATNSKQNK